jgi:hypothetical protein
VKSFLSFFLAPYFAWYNAGIKPRDAGMKESARLLDWGSLLWASVMPRLCVTQ